MNSKNDKAYLLMIKQALIPVVNPYSKCLFHKVTSLLLEI